MADILVMKTKGKHAPDADKGKPDKEKLIKGNEPKAVSTR